MDYRQHAAEASTAKIAYTASGSAVIFGLAANEFAALVGAAIAVLAFITNTAIQIYYQQKHLKLKQKEINTDKTEEE